MKELITYLTNHHANVPPSKPCQISISENTTSQQTTSEKHQESYEELFNDPPSLPPPLEAFLDDFFPDLSQCTCTSSQPVQISSFSTPSVTPSVQLALSSIDVVKVRNKSCSRKNFAANLVRKLFSDEEMKTSNVRGVLGKN